MKSLKVVLLVFLNLTVNSQNKFTKMVENVKNDESSVLSIVRQLIKCMIEKDTVTMSNILDKNFTLTHITGYIQPKEEWFSEIQKESMKYYSANEVNHKVDIKSTKATVVIQDLLDARIWGSRNVWRLQQTIQLEKRNEHWIIIRSVATTF